MAELAKEIGSFMYDFDYYEVMDTCGGLEEVIMEVADNLKRKVTRKDVARYLRDVAEDDWYLFEDRLKAAKLYRKVVTL